MNRRPLLIYSAIVVGLMLVASAWAWTQLPPDASIPVHWGFDGQINGYAPKALGLFGLPLLTIGVVALFMVIPAVEPRRENLERSARAYGATWVGVVTLLGVIDLLVIATALGASLDMSRFVLAGIGALFVIIGNYLPTVRSNYLMGIRTPWTLTSERSWVQTHRVGGRLFVLEGFGLFALALLGASPEWLFGVILAAVGVLIVFVFAYSYRVWKADPDRRTA
jgi:uncharacterized membrane protein